MRVLYLVGAWCVLSTCGMSAEASDWWRPCGPGNSCGGNRLFRQGSHGADFRPACQAHDDCYQNGCGRRKDCDRQFRDEMFAACDCSSNPGACRRHARAHYIGARLFGWLAY